MVKTMPQHLTMDKAVLGRNSRQARATPLSLLPTQPAIAAGRAGEREGEWPDVNERTNEPTNKQTQRIAMLPGGSNNNTFHYNIHAMDSKFRTQTVSCILSGDTNHF